MNLSEQLRNNIFHAYNSNENQHIDFCWDEKNLTTQRLIYIKEDNAFVMGPEVNFSLSGYSNRGIESIFIRIFKGENFDSIDEWIEEVVSEWEGCIQKVKEQNQKVVNPEAFIVIAESLKSDEEVVLDTCMFNEEEAFFSYSPEKKAWLLWRKTKGDERDILRCIPLLDLRFGSATAAISKATLNWTILRGSRFYDEGK